MQHQLREEGKSRGSRKAVRGGAHAPFARFFLFSSFLFYSLTFLVCHLLRCCRCYRCLQDALVTDKVTVPE